jgi:cytochrome c oxidase cbb3-type subunit 2
MESLRKFVYGLAVCFGLPWFLLVVRPYLKERNREPIPYTSNETHPDLKGQVDTEFFENPNLRGVYFPQAATGNKSSGAAVYGRLGCAQCHTQMIRPTYLGNDSWKLGWGPSQEAGKLVNTRQTTPWDYYKEDFAMIGQRRIGPDLANAGYRFPSVNAIHAKLFAPRSILKWSSHPSYPSLYDVVAIEGTEKRKDALILPASANVPTGMQVVPNGQAKLLADYIMVLKRDQPLPMSVSQATMADKAAPKN